MVPTHFKIAAVALADCLGIASARSAEPPPVRVDALSDPLPDGAVARLGSTLLSPGQNVQTLEFSPDGKRVAINTWGGTDPGMRLTIADTATGRELRNTALPCRFLQMRWLADGRGLAVVKLTKKDFYVWEFTSEQNPLPPRDRFDNTGFDDDPRDVAISPDGHWLALDRHRHDHGVRAVELRVVVPNSPLENLVKHDLDVGGGFVSIIFSPDSRHVFVLRRERKPGLPPVTGWGIDGMRNLIDGARLTVYEVSTRKQVVSLKVAGPLMVTHPVDAPRQALSPDGRTLYVGDDAGVIHAYDWAAGREIKSFEPHPAADPKIYEVSGIRSLALSTDGRTLFSVGRSNSVSVTDLAAEKPAGRRVDPAWRVEQVVASPDGRRVAAAGASISGRITFLDAKTGADLLPRAGHASMIGSFTVTADGTVVTVAGMERTVCWWDAERGRELRRKRIDGTGNLLLPTLTADGRGLFAVTAGNIEFFDLESGLKSVVAQGPITPFAAIMGVRGSTVFHTANGDKVRQWDAATGRMRQEFNSAGQRGVGGNPASLSPDGKRVVLLGSKWVTSGQVGFFNSSQILFCDAATGELKRRWHTAEARLECAAWSDDGRHLLVAGGPGAGSSNEGLEDELPISAKSALVLFDARTGEPLRTFEPVSQVERRPLWINSVTFSPDGNFFAVAQVDGAVHVYELATGRPCRSFRGHRAQVSQVAFADRGRRLISVSYDMTGLVWDSSLANLAKPRDLGTDAQREQAWAVLAKPEWELAGPAVAALAGRPDDLVALVRSHLKPAGQPGVDAAELAKLVARLDDPLFAVRERAAAALGRLGREALPLLQDHFTGTSSAETRKRLQQAIREIAAVPVASTRLREMRVVATLEQAGAETARAELKRLASGHADAALTRDAAAALRRESP